MTNGTQLPLSLKQIPASIQDVPLEPSNNILLPVKQKVQCQQEKKAKLHNLTYGKVLFVLLSSLLFECVVKCSRLLLSLCRQAVKIVDKD